MRLASLLTQILASTTLLACGGATTDPGGGSTSGGASGGTSGNGSSSGSTSSSGSSSGGSTSSSGTNPPPTKPPPPPRNCQRYLDSRDAKACVEVWVSPCGYPAGVDPSDGLTWDECKRVCGEYSYGCNEKQGDFDSPSRSFNCFTCVEGRRPQGYVDPELEASVAGWLAHAADLERVSIDAFQILRRELAHYGAPSDLLAEIERAEADEVRHARTMTMLAKREGATPRATSVAHEDVRALVAIAIENGVEGCVRETYGALVAGYQARSAARRDIRRVMTTIEADETRHAELAWSVHAWLMNRLTPCEREVVIVAMREAADALVVSAGAPLAEHIARPLGLPSARDAARLVAALDAGLWAPALAA